MPLSPFFLHGSPSEQRLVQDLVNEHLKMFGQDVYYIPRVIVDQDPMFDEDSLSKFEDAYIIEAYLENVQGFEGDGDLYSKFGVRISDQVTFVIARTRFTELVDDNATLIVEGRPNEGDLVYFPLANKLFQIQYVEYETPFFQLGKIHTWGLKCELYEYADEDFNTGVDAIDKVERNLSTTITLNFATGGSGDFTVGEKVAGGTSEVKSWNSTDRQLQLFNRSGIFTIPETVTGQTSSAAWTTASYNTLNNTNSAFDQNQSFETLADGILDFTQGNPFGEFGQKS